MLGYASAALGGVSRAGREGLVLVAEQVRELGGTERVVQAMAVRYPDAALVAADFATTNVPEGHPHPLLQRARLVRVGARRRHFLSPLYARRFARAPLPPGELVFSFVHSGWAAAVEIPTGARHVSYTAGLAKFLYGHSETYLRDYPRALRPLLRAALPLLRARHGKLLARADRVLTNSNASAQALRRVHGVDAEVVYPPVRTAFFTPADTPRRHFLVVARLVRHKQVGLVVRAFADLPGERLVVVGGGDQLAELRAIAPPNVSFAGFVPDGQLRELYRASHALVCPSVEEFGIVMAEALACGVPVIAPAAGGALEMVTDGATGLLLPEVTPAALAAAVRRLGDLDAGPSACRAAALAFDESRFLDEIARVLEEELAIARRRAPAPRAAAAAPAPGSRPPAHGPAPAPLSTPARP
jgi:glycosyltransferase involved in cell wall biosynthesis